MNIKDLQKFSLNRKNCVFCNMDLNPTNIGSPLLECKNHNNIIVIFGNNVLFYQYDYKNITYYYNVVYRNGKAELTNNKSNVLGQCILSHYTYEIICPEQLINKLNLLLNFT